MLGKSLRCPKCRQTFRASGFANLDFDDRQPVGETWSESEIPTAPAPMWTAPVREVPVIQEKPTLSAADAARFRKRRETSLLVIGGSVGAVMALVILVAGSIAVWRSIKRNADNTTVSETGENPSASALIAPGDAKLATILGFDEQRRALLVDYLVSQGNGKPKARLTMAMVVNALKRLAADFNVDPTEEFPPELELLRERVVMRDVPEELLKSEKIPAVFQQMISEYQEKKLGPAEEEVAILVILAFLGAEM